jgi:hypothetical protein
VALANDQGGAAHEVRWGLREEPLDVAGGLKSARAEVVGMLASKFERAASRPRHRQAVQGRMKHLLGHQLRVAMFAMHAQCMFVTQAAEKTMSPT